MRLLQVNLSHPGLQVSPVVILGIFYYNNTMFENDLKQLGLSDKEAKVYLAVLELGPSTAIQIAQKAEINRPTAYVQIENLMKLGLMSSHEKGKKTYFAAEPPERLQELVRKNQMEIEERGRRLKEILPELQVLFDSAEERPKVRFYEGKEGIKAIHGDIFKLGNKEILTFYSFDFYDKFFDQKERVDTEKVRQRKHITGRALYTRKAGRFLEPPPASIKDRFVPPDKFPFSASIDIYDDKIAVHALRGKVAGVIIENQDVASTMRSVFDLAWEAAEKYQENK